MTKKLPKSWNQISLEESLIFILGGDWGIDLIANNELDFERAKVIRGTDYKDWKNSRAKYAPIRLIKKGSLEKRKLLFGDIILEVSGGGPDQPVGRTIIIDEIALNEKLPLVCSNFFRQMRISHHLNPFFINHYLTHSYFKGHCNEFQTQTTNLRNLNVNKYISMTSIPLPPLPEQQRIADKIEKLFTRSKKIKTNLDQVPKQLERLRKSILAAAFRGDLTKDWREKNPNVEPSEKLLEKIRKDRKARKRTNEINLKNISLNIPQSWIITNIDSISDDIADCSHSTPKWSESGKLCLRTNNFLINKLVLDEKKFVSKKIYEERISRLKPEFGDILYSREGGILGIACILDIEEDVCLGQRMMIFRVNKSIINKYICYYMNSPFINVHVSNLISGSAAPHINVGDIKEYPIPLPPLAEQKEIVRRVEKLLANVDKLEAAYKQYSQKLNTLNQSILAKAFRGELVPQDPNDEPASVLLERIKAEKGK